MLCGAAVHIDDPLGQVYVTWMWDDTGKVDEVHRDGQGRRLMHLPRADMTGYAQPIAMEAVLANVEFLAPGAKDNDSELWALNLRDERAVDEQVQRNGLGGAAASSSADTAPINNGEPGPGTGRGRQPLGPTKGDAPDGGPSSRARARVTGASSSRAQQGQPESPRPDRSNRRSARATGKRDVGSRTEPRGGAGAKRSR